MILSTPTEREEVDRVHLEFWFLAGDELVQLFSSRFSTYEWFILLTWITNRKTRWIVEFGENENNGFSKNWKWSFWRIWHCYACGIIIIYYEFNWFVLDCFFISKNVRLRVEFFFLDSYFSLKWFYHHTGTESSSFFSFFSSESSELSLCATIYETADFSISIDESSLHCIPRDTIFKMKLTFCK